MNNNSASVRRPAITQEWSLRAELTFSHPQPTSGGTNNQSDPNNRMHMQYLWNNQPEQSDTARHTLHPCYGFQRGNILFTTTPPSHSVQKNLSRASQNTRASSVQQPSRVNQTPQTFNQNPASSFPKYDIVSGRTSQPYNRRCKSTCSIILSGDHNTSQKPSGTIGTDVRSADRGRSCSPVTRCYHTLTHRCGDPVCYHSTTSSTPVQDSVSGCEVSSAIPESCEVCGGGRSPTAIRRASRANTFTTHFCTRVPERIPTSTSNEKKNEGTVTERRDAAIQTSDVLPVENLNQQTLKSSSISNKVKQKIPSVCQSSPVSLPGSSMNKAKVCKKSSHSSTKSKGRSSSQQEGEKSANSELSNPSAGSSSHKPRTVHIDVYCTGSEDADADTSNLSCTDTDSVEGESWSSPQTVFESDKLRVVHTRASKNQLPQALQHQQVSRKKTDSSQGSGSFKYKSPRVREVPSPKGFDSDDGLTSQYPSKDSSYTTFQGAGSSLQSDIPGASRDASWSTLSSSVACSDGYDSATATSWKDTATELDSLAQSSVSLTQSDSFEYADAIDRLRIREKERAWAGEETEEIDKSKTWQCPQTERKRLIQQQKLKEYVEKHLGKTGFPLWKPVSREDSDDDEDETGDTWSFGGGPSSPKVGTIRKDNIKKLEKDKSSSILPCQVSTVEGKIEDASPKSFKSNISHLLGDSGSLSDSGPAYCHRFICRDVIGPFGSKSPSPPPAKLESTVTLPFTTVFGRRTDQLLKAQKFGTIVGAFRKPGHHVGPSKNPDCSCVHCREYYEGGIHRGRARSVGAVPLGSDIG